MNEPRTTFCTCTTKREIASHWRQIKCFYKSKLSLSNICGVSFLYGTLKPNITTKMKFKLQCGFVNRRYFCLPFTVLKVGYH